MILPEESPAARREPSGEYEIAVSVDRVIIFLDSVMEEPEMVWMRIVQSEAPMAIWSVQEAEMVVGVNLGVNVAVGLRALS